MAADDQTMKMGQVIAKTWSDEAFKTRLLSDPAATLKAEGVVLPAGVEVRTVENTDTVFHLVLPAKPPAGELSDEDLEHVAAGICMSKFGQCF